MRLVGVDANEWAAGRLLCDAFHTVPPGADPGYVDALAARDRAGRPMAPRPAGTKPVPYRHPRDEGDVVDK